MNASWKATGRTAKGCYGHCDFYSAEQLNELISYGKKTGVRLVPSTGMMPGAKAEIVRILNGSMLPPDVGYKFHDWMDEVDQQGPSTYTGALLLLLLLLSCCCWYQMIPLAVWQPRARCSRLLPSS
jgi:hypothetical protein